MHISLYSSLQSTVHAPLFTNSRTKDKGFRRSCIRRHGAGAFSGPSQFKLMSWKKQSRDNLKHKRLVCGFPMTRERSSRELFLNAQSRALLICHRSCLKLTANRRYHCIPLFPSQCLLILCLPPHRTKLKTNEGRTQPKPSQRPKVYHHHSL